MDEDRFGISEHRRVVGPRPKTGKKPETTKSLNERLLRYWNNEVRGWVT